MSSEKRRDQRYPFRVRVAISVGRQEIVTQTDDVSFNGIFLRMDSPPPERQLVRMIFSLPPSGDPLTVMGMVARVTPALNGRPPGAGIRFYGVEQMVRNRWQSFVRHVASAPPPAPPARETTLPPAQAPVFPPETPDAVRRRFARHAVSLRIRLQTVGELHELYTRNVSKGGLLVRTELDLPLRSLLKVQVLHPGTGDTFHLEAVVRWRGEPPETGLGIEFVNVTDERRNEFFEFIRSEIPVEEVVYVAGDDPRLAPAGPPKPGEPLDGWDVPLDDDLG